MGITEGGVRKLEQAEINESITLATLRKLAEALDCDQVPPYGPGENSRPPTDCELYIHNYIEVPKGGPLGGPGCAAPQGNFESVPSGQSLPYRQMLTTRRK